MAPTGLGEHTVAQFARRAGMSPTRARKLLADGKLPPEDDINPDGDKVWYAPTIDRWLRATGRPIPPGSLWPYSWPNAERPLEAVSSTLTLTRGRSAALTTWFMPDGPAVLYAVGYTKENTSDEELAAAAAQSLPAKRRPGAVILLPYLLPFGGDPHPHLDLWRILDDDESADDGDAPNGWSTESRLPGFLRRLIASPPKTMPQRTPGAGHREPGVPYWAGTVSAEEAARVLGAPVPLWWGGTNTPDALRTVQVLGRAVSLRVPDTVTDWPPARDRLEAALDKNLIATHPNAFTLLARDARDAYSHVHHDHQQYPASGTGWYIAAIPEPPQWPVVLEHRAALAADRPLDDGAADELRELRRQEQDLPWQDGDHYAAALQLACRGLATELCVSDPATVYDYTVCYRWSEATGPICEEFRRHLTPLPTDDPHANPDKPTRRLARLLTEDANDTAIVYHRMLDHARTRLRGLYRDPTGRLVADLDSGIDGDKTTLMIEWPVGLPPTEWNPDAIIAADRAVSATGVFALTTGLDGALQPPEPVPNPASAPGYTFGYGGDSPANLYQALVRCALRDWDAAQPAWVWTRHMGDGERRSSSSELWHEIVTSQTRLRLSWADVQRWARTDAARRSGPPASGFEGRRE